MTEIENTFRSVEHAGHRRTLIGLILVNTLIYISVSWMPFQIVWHDIEFYVPLWMFSIVPFLIIVYNPIEMLLFIRYEKWSWPVTLTFRIIWILCNGGLVTSCGFALIAAPDICSYVENWCKQTILFVPMLLHYAGAFVLEIITLVVYSKLPRTKCCCPITAVQYPIAVVNEDGTIQNAIQIPRGQLVYMVNESKPDTLSSPQIQSFSNPSFQQSDESSIIED